MKTPAKDIVLIGVTLVVILGCGYGIGKRTAPEARAIDPSPIEVAIEGFEDMTLSSLRASLNLSEEQVAAILPEIDTTSDNIAQSRKKALFSYYLHIRDLHDRLLPKLDSEQQEQLLTSRKNLQKVIEKRFPVLLDRHDSTTGGGSKNRD